MYEDGSQETIVSREATPAIPIALPGHYYRTMVANKARFNALGTFYDVSLRFNDGQRKLCIVGMPAGFNISVGIHVLCCQEFTSLNALMIVC